VTIPTCQAQLCDGVADDRSRLCAEHRRALTLTTKIQDAVREYLNGNLRPHDALRPTAEGGDLTPCVGHAESRKVGGGSEMIHHDGKEKLP